MKIKALLLGLLVSTQSFAANAYEFLSVPHSDVDQYLTIGSDETQTPESIQGLWWLNGNPLRSSKLFRFFLQSSCRLLCLSTSN
ncbi:MAG: hypothetical protein EOP10_11330 [Proteobacteria bacterium]|nr:MAG: hypothetical protein EOP10_11330 [Pseudomonadota bacterium]